MPGFRSRSPSSASCPCHVTVERAEAFHATPIVWLPSPETRPRATRRSPYASTETAQKSGPGGRGSFDRSGWSTQLSALFASASERQCRETSVARPHVAPLGASRSEAERGDVSGGVGGAEPP